MSIPGSFHQQYPVIARLSEALAGKLNDAFLHEAYTLSKEELVLVFQSAGSFFTIKTVHRYQTCFLLFDEQQPPKVSNAQACFEAITGSWVLSIEQHSGTRSFSVHFGGEFQLVFKMYDGLVNIVLYNNGKATDMFRTGITKDWETPLLTVATGGNKVSETTAAHFYIYKRDHSHAYYLAIEKQEDELIFDSGNVLYALHEFSRLCLGYYHFYFLKQRIIARLQDEIKKLTGLVERTQSGLQQLELETTPEEIANIIMANLHAIQPQSTAIELFDFYHGKTISVKLKKELNAQQNAAYYYRKAKNRKMEGNQLSQKLAASRQRIVQLNADLETATNASGIKSLKPFLPKEKQQQVHSPFRQFEFEGFKILVGKSAANNDELTVKHAHKNDLWLHAKDVAGSHVVIKWKPGQEFSGKVITCAAELAAYYSKLKGSNLVPVSYTLKKFVRKPKGSEPGEVTVDKEEVIMVEPKLPG
jgi:hypothetical protein